MNKAETGRILTVLRAVYPTFYRDATPEDAAALIDLWTDMFAEDDYEAVSASVRALIATDEKGFPPTVGAVKAKLRTLFAPPELTPQEAWALVAKAVSNGYYGAAEEFAALPPDVQRIVGSASQIKKWTDVESNTLHTVIASNFQRSYAMRMEQKREHNMLPASIRQMLPESAADNRLTAGFLKMIGG